MRSSFFWSKEDIERLQVLYFAGWTLRQMAKELGRSPTSINKILSRWGIRPKRLDQPREPLTPYHFEREWVHIRTVISYLQASGARVFPVHPIKNPLGLRQFIVNNVLISAGQLLFLVNKDRVNLGKSTYLVDGITWM